MQNTIKVQGADAKSFLNAQSTIKINDNAALYCAFLSPNSEIKGLAYLINLNNIEIFLLLKDRLDAENLKLHLEKFIILDKVELSLVSDSDLTDELKAQIPADINFEDYSANDSLVKLHQRGNYNIFDKYFPEEKGCFPGQEVLSKYINIGLKKRALRAQEYTEKARDIFTQAEDKSEWTKAKELLNKAISEDPKNEEAYETLGVILGREENYKEAIEIMKKLDAVNPASIMAKTNLSIFYMRLGDKERAEEYKAKATVAQFDEALKK